MAQFIFTMAVLAAELGLAKPAKSSNHHRSLSGRGSVSARDEAIAYSPISSSVMADVEYRPNTSPSSVGDYVAQGLSSEIDLVTQEYGLRDSESFYWGLDGMPLANLTAFADGEDVRVLSVERFDGVLDSAECSTSSIKLTFSGGAQFQDISSAWTWINDAAGSYVVLVTDSSQCNVADGDATIRQPWHVTHATFDATTNTVLLDAEPKTWDEAFGTWHLTIDSRGLLPSQSIRRRGLQSRSNGDITIPLGYDLSGYSFGLPNDGSATCRQCNTTGRLDFIIEIDTNVADLRAGDLSGTFKVIATDVGTNFDMDIDLELDGGTSQASAFVTASPPIGILIAGIISIKPELQFGILASTTVSGDVVISTAFSADIPDGATALVTISAEAEDHLTTNHTDWTPVYASHDTRFSENVNVSGSIGPYVQLDLAVAPIGLGKLFKATVGLMLTAPELIVDAVVFDDSTATLYSCPAPVDEVGISLQLSLGLDFDSTEDLHVLFEDIKETQTIYATSTPLVSTCIESTAVIPTKAAAGPGPIGTLLPINATNTTVPHNAPYGSSSCPTHGALACNGPRYYALCNWGTALWQPVADGTACENGQIVGTGIYAVPPEYPSDQGSASCDVDGELVCNGVTQFGLCNWGTVVWQPVAAGTQCQQGAIVRDGVYASPTPTPQ